MCHRTRTHDQSKGKIFEGIKLMVFFYHKCIYFSSKKRMYSQARILFSKMLNRFKIIVKTSFLGEI